MVGVSVGVGVRVGVGVSVGVGVGVLVGVLVAVGVGVQAAAEAVIAVAVMAACCSGEGPQADKINIKAMQSSVLFIIHLAGYGPNWIVSIAFSTKASFFAS